MYLSKPAKLIKCMYMYVKYKNYECNALKLRIQRHPNVYCKIHHSIYVRLSNSKSAKSYENQLCLWLEIRNIKCL